MAFIDDCLADERDQREAKTRDALYDLYLQGANDAAFAQLPQYQDEVYLEGYLTKLKQLPKDEDGRIKHYSPAQHFAFGYVDTPNPAYYNDDF